MNDELDPKLQEFEAKLRRLKPLTVAGSVSDRLERPKTGRLRSRLLFGVLVTAAIVLIVICLIPPSEPLPVSSPLPPPVEPVVIAPKPFPTMRQQLGQLLDEMRVAKGPEEKQAEYPVVEIAVCNSPVSTVNPPFERTRWRIEEQLMF